MILGVIGIGYVGLSTAVSFAGLNYKVVCYDTNPEKCLCVQREQSPFFEPELDDMLKSHIVKSNLSVAQDAAELIRRCDVIMVAVGTPSREDGSADLSYVDAVMLQIEDVLVKDDVPCEKIVLLRSTVPVGTTSNYQSFFSACFEGTDIKVSVAFNAEFLREGSAVHDFLNPDRIVIGAETPEITLKIKSLYTNFFNRGIPVICTNPSSAEIIKYASNIYLSAKIAIINEIADVAEEFNGRIGDIAVAVGLDKRIGSEFLKASPGYGGSCFKKDLDSFSYLAGAYGFNDLLISKINQSNDNHILRTTNKIVEIVKTAKKIAVLGTAFKAGTDDLRESVPVKIIRNLLGRGYELTVHDPEALANTRAVFGDSLRYGDDVYSTVSGAQTTLILTEWQDYAGADYAEIKRKMKGNILIDLRNVLQRNAMELIGFKYYGIAN